ncbi:MAG: hypothetical protein K8R59_18715, partial [Thermoanaerobaculales bacterium]|nr:hypothetical protein [Thermoanaerobaculales bacterium]
VIDVSDPFDPSEIGFYETPGLPHDVAVSGGYVYLADFYAGFKVFIDNLLFSDGFESGDLSAWTAAKSSTDVPYRNSGCYRFDRFP